jgi:hypothetical protein
MVQTIVPTQCVHLQILKWVLYKWHYLKNDLDLKAWSMFDSYGCQQTTLRNLALMGYYIFAQMGYKLSLLSMIHQVTELANIS